MVFLVGLTHEVQYQLIAKAEELCKFFNNFLIVHSIKVVAEEWSDDCSIGNKIHETHLEKIAKSLGLKYLAVDPNKLRRQQLKIYKGENYWPKREKYWLHQIRPYLNKPCLLACGSSHIISLGGNSPLGIDKLLKREKVDYRLINKRFDKLFSP